MRASSEHAQEMLNAGATPVAAMAAVAEPGQDYEQLMNQMLADGVRGLLAFSTYDRNADSRKNRRAAA